MFSDGYGLPEGEVQKEEAKMEIRQLFSDLELKTSDPEFNIKAESKRSVAFEKMLTKAEDGSMREEAIEALIEYIETLEEIADQVPGDEQHLEESMLARIKASVSDVKLRYETGNIESAIEVLDDEEGGVLTNAWENKRSFESFQKIYDDLNRLIELLYLIKKSDK